MSTLFNDENSDSEKELKINNGYASNYNTWRQKEELNKFKTKYGEHVTNFPSSGEDSETSSDEDEDGAELTEELEKKFYKTLACLKNKDPKIYDEKVTFFDEISKNPEESSNKKSSKEKKLFLRDYEREIVVQRGGKFSDSEDEETIRNKKRKTRAPTYVEEQLALKESISKALDDEDEDEENNLLVPKTKTESEKLKEDEAYKEWLKGQKAEIESSEKEELKPLRDFWVDPNLDPKEKFLRDYILNKKFLGNDDAEEDNLDDERIDLSEDEKIIEEQEEFEHKYNFRFEEPDQEFIKRYPRTLENSLRKKDNRRALKRAEVKQRKEEEKIRKQEELKQLKALKRKEIADKIAQLKEITGNDDNHFENIDLDADFDPEEHDRKMQEIFNDDYYALPEDDVKPEFPEIDEELGIERNWDDYDPENEELVPDDDSPRPGTSHCEDPEFNMDADYDPTQALQNELIASTKKKKRRRKSKFAEVIAKEKPKFDPKLHASYRDYIEQYYALDYEDMIDDLPCRFKYRKVVPNDYGLSVEEILVADDRELNKWCSLKKALEHKPENVELNEVRVYQQKAKNEEYKKKILKSLYTPEEEPQDPETVITPTPQEAEEAMKKKRKRKKKSVKKKGITSPRKGDGKAEQESAQNENEISEIEIPREIKAETSMKETSEEKPAKKLSKGSPTKLQINEKETVPMKPAVTSKKRKAAKNPDSVASSNPEVREPLAKKLKSEIISTETIVESTVNGITNGETKMKKKKKNLNTQDNSSSANSSKNMKNVERMKKNKNKNATDDHTNSTNSTKNTKDPKSMKKQNKNKSTNSTGEKKFKGKKQEADSVALLSSERLKAYGLNPKKFKNKLKYGKKMN
ncbi:protein KRI1 homolog [Venturia canescens]|uniref:protein KRI1 homolog n=1 Tax=Venturia canescens TaxID=32260 RepID=UPI001C9C50F0|nr:protein KRI1 homolog [Venturia canescens]